MDVIALETQQVASVATTWGDQSTNLTASQGALSDLGEVSVGFTERVRPTAVAFASAWSALTGTLAADCHDQSAALRAAASALAEADEAVRARLRTIGAA